MARGHACSLAEPRTREAEANQVVPRSDSDPRRARPRSFMGACLLRGSRLPPQRAAEAWGGDRPLRRGRQQRCAARQDPLLGLRRHRSDYPAAELGGLDHRPCPFPRRSKFIEKKAAGQPIEMDSLQITDRAGPHPGRRRFRCRSRAGYIHAYEAIGDGSALSLWH